MNGKQVISGREKIGIGGVGGDSEKAEVHAEVNEAKGDTRRGMTRMMKVRMWWVGRRMSYEGIKKAVSVQSLIDHASLVWKQLTRK